jgi:hypothetical protein
MRVKFCIIRFGHVYRVRRQRWFGWHTIDVTSSEMVARDFLAGYIRYLQDRHKRGVLIATEVVDL